MPAQDVRFLLLAWNTGNIPGTWYLVPGSIRYQAVVTIIVLLLFSHQSLAPYSEMVIRQGLTSEVEEY